MNHKKSMGALLVTGILFILCLGIGAFFYIYSSEDSIEGVKDPASHLNTLLLAGKFRDSADFIKKLDTMKHKETPLLKAAYLTKLHIWVDELIQEDRQGEALENIDLILAVVPDDHRAQKIRESINGGNQPESSGAVSGITNMGELSQSPHSDGNNSSNNQTTPVSAELADSNAADNSFANRDSTQQHSAIKGDTTQSETPQPDHQQHLTASSKRDHPVEATDVSNIIITDPEPQSTTITTSKSQKASQEQLLTLKRESQKKESISNSIDKLETLFRNRDILEQATKIISESERLESLDMKDFALNYKDRLKTAFLTAATQKESSKQFSAAQNILIKGEKIFKNNTLFSVKRAEIKNSETKLKMRLAEQKELAIKKEQEARIRAEKAQKVATLEAALRDQIKNPLAAKNARQFFVDSKSLRDMGETLRAQKIEDEYKARVMRESETLLEKKDFKRGIALITLMQSVSGNSNYLKTQKIKIKGRETLFARSRARRPVPPTIKPTIIKRLPKVIIIVKNGDNLKSRVESAPENTTVHIYQGHYHGPIHLKKNINIIGKGRENTVLISATNSPVFTISGHSVKISNCTILGKGSSPEPAVLIKAGKTTIANCYLNSEGKNAGRNFASIVKATGGHLFILDSFLARGSGMGIILSGTSKFSVKRCEIDSCSSFGLYVTDSATGLIQGCKVFKSGMSGITITSNGKTTLLHNESYDNSHYGVLVYDGARPKIKSNQLYRNGISGIEIRDNVKVTLEKNKINQNSGAGISGEGKDTIITLKGNTITSNKKGPTSSSRGARFIYQ